MEAHKKYYREDTIFKVDNKRFQNRNVLLCWKKRNDVDDLNYNFID